MEGVIELLVDTGAHERWQFTEQADAVLLVGKTLGQCSIEAEVEHDLFLGYFRVVFSNDTDAATFRMLCDLNYISREDYEFRMDAWRSGLGDLTVGSTKDARPVWYRRFLLRGK